MEHENEITNVLEEEISKQSWCGKVYSWYKENPYGSWDVWRCCIEYTPSEHKIVMRAPTRIEAIMQAYLHAIRDHRKMESKLGGPPGTVC